MIADGRCEPRFPEAVRRTVHFIEAVEDAAREKDSRYKIAHQSY